MQKCANLTWTEPSADPLTNPSASALVHFALTPWIDALMHFSILSQVSMLPASCFSRTLSDIHPSRASILSFSFMHTEEKVNAEYTVTTSFSPYFPLLYTTKYLINPYFPFCPCNRSEMKDPQDSDYNFRAQIQKNITHAAIDSITNFSHWSIHIQILALLAHRRQQITSKLHYRIFYTFRC